ncbi:MAG: hypothetical protein WD342_05830 [Verrucomicrobiales bacterium]
MKYSASILGLALVSALTVCAQEKEQKKELENLVAVLAPTEGNKTEGVVVLQSNGDDIIIESDSDDTADTLTAGSSRAGGLKGAVLEADTTADSTAKALENQVAE